MGTIRVKQNSFIAGLLSKSIHERTDKPQIAHGMKVADNVCLHSSGGVYRRPGSTYVDDVAKTLVPIELGFSITCPNGGISANLKDNNPETIFKTTTAIGSTDNYVCFQVTFSSSQFVDYFDVLGCSLDNGDKGSPNGNSEFHVETSTDGSTWKSAKQLYLTYINSDYYRAAIHATIKHVRVIRKGTTELTDTYFKCQEMRFYTSTGGVQSGFRLASLVYGATANYLMIFTDNMLTIYRNDLKVAECPLPFVEAQYLRQLKFCACGESLIVTHKEIAPFMVQRYLNDNAWRVFPVEFSNVPMYDAALTREVLSGNIGIVNDNEAYHAKCDKDVFLSSDVGCIISGNGGRGRVIQYISATEVRVSVINKFSFYGENPKHDGWTIERNTKPLWGKEYGYPECCGIFANRLYFGGSKRAPDVIAASVIGDYLNFSTGDLQADDAMIVRLSTGHYNHGIRYIFSGDNLEVFTDIGVFALKKFDSGSITDLSSSFYYRTSIAIDPYTQPFRTEDSGTIFLKAGRSDLRELEYSNDSYSYVPRSRALWFNDAIKDTISIGVSARPVDHVSTYVYCVRSDGGMGCLSFLLTDNIHVATNWKTKGKYLACETNLQGTYFAVERNGKIYLERLVDDSFLDSEKVFRNCTGGQLTGLGHLAGQTVQVRADNEYLGEFVVSSGGAITITTGRWDVVHVGLGYESLIVPLIPDQQDSTLMGMVTKYTRATISVYDTQEILVNGVVPEFLGRDYSLDNSFAALSYKTGRYRVLLGSGSSLEPEIKISSDKPLPFHLRSIQYELEVN